MPRIRATAIIIEDNKILLIHRKNDKDYYVFPGGGVEDGESTEQAVLRELMEETSISAEVIKLLEHQTYKDGTENHSYLCRYISGTPKLADDSPEKMEMAMGKEYYEPVWINLNRVKELDVFPAVAKEKILQNFEGLIKL